MEKPFRCVECDSRFGLKHLLRRHQTTVHEKVQRFQCAECPTSYNRKDNLVAHVKRDHEGPHAMLETKVNLGVHMSTRHYVKGPAGSKRKPTVQQNAACLAPPSKRHKEEPPSAEAITDKDGEQHIVREDGADQRSAKPENDSPPLVLRLRTTVSVNFKTSSGRVRIAEDQQAPMTYGGFRKLFDVPLETPKRIEFKKSADQWIVALDDNMKLPLVDGCIVAETCTDF